MGGINIPLLSAAAMTGLGQVLSFRSHPDTTVPIGNAAPFRPPQWSKPALVMITIPAPYVQALGYQQGTQVAAQVVDANGAQISAPITRAPANASPVFLVFDAVMRTSHSQQARPTRKPVQDAASMTDHVILEPATLGLDIVMSDVLPAYAPGQWIGNASKSISCFMVLDAIRAARIPLIVTTRLKTYTNMILVNAPSEDTVKTRYGLRAHVQFEQVFIGSVATQSVSARSQTTDSTTLGTTNPTPVPNGVTSQNMLPSTATGAPSSSDLQHFLGEMPGAGNFSSNNTGPLGADDSDGS